ncbi:MAG: hypothetical protein EPN91_12450 [Salinibacterium sp.]|nr:MAG: hypothetical protein EPN91_12450 [Salinibacterium sp.]
MLPVADGVQVTSVLTAGDRVGGYRMVGKPDGLGAFDNGDGTFTVLMNHELDGREGVTRAHGAQGAFVSTWVIDKSTLRVLSGSDLIKTPYLWDGTAYVARPGTIFRHFCSADLPAPSALYNRTTGKGYDGRIFLNGEEVVGGRAFGHVVATGNSYQLPAFQGGKWENIVANPATGDSTVVAGTSDLRGGAVSIYVGTKKSSGNPVQKAGLTGGTLYRVSVAGMSSEDPGANWSGDRRFTLTTGAGTGWARPEDSAWDPSHPEDLYFATTASFSEHSRLWRLRFDDIDNPRAGGSVSLVVQGAAGGAAGPNMMDNLTVTGAGEVLVQEDPGNESYLAGIYRVDAATGHVHRVARHDPARFSPGGAHFDTTAEESSGIVWAPFLGDDTYLFDVQDHLGVTGVTGVTVVQKGQLLLMRVPASAG